MNPAAEGTTTASPASPPPTAPKILAHKTLQQPSIKTITAWFPSPVPETHGPTLVSIYIYISSNALSISLTVEKAIRSSKPSVICGVRLNLIRTSRAIDSNVKTLTGLPQIIFLRRMATSSIDREEGTDFLEPTLLKFLEVYITQEEDLELASEARSSERRRSTR